MLLHRDRDEFIKILGRASSQTGFPHRLLEKDYYLTVILSQVNETLSPNLILKGGTCLNKIYLSYYRLSEDLDFSLRLPRNNTTRGMRRKTIKPIKESIQAFVESLEMNIDDPEKAGHRESTQYIFYFSYDSVVLNKTEKVKVEVGLRFNPMMPLEEKKINHKFLHPFTGEPLFDGGKIICLALKELAAEKMRAAATRLTIAPRDFYDLGYLLKVGFDFIDMEFLDIFRKKLAEDNFSVDLKKYRHNLGRAKEEIDDMNSRIEEELFPVLPVKVKNTFNIYNVLREINEIFKILK
jgi:predicted nucleotidyltransferase component of viral defense system